jgi:hypothetical protein
MTKAIKRPRRSIEPELRADNPNPSVEVSLPVEPAEPAPAEPAPVEPVPVEPFLLETL